MRHEFRHKERHEIRYQVSWKVPGICKILIGILFAHDKWIWIISKVLNQLFRRNSYEEPPSLPTSRPQKGSLMFWNFAQL